MELLNLTTPQKNISDAEIGQNFHNNIGGRVIIKDIRDLRELKKALVKIINLEDCFKIRIIKKNGKLFQYFDSDFLFKETDIKSVSFDNLSDYHAWEKGQFSQNLFREKSPLFKLYLCKAENSIILFFLASHFITDGYSLVVNLLNKLLADEKTPINSYKEYIKDEDKYLNSKRYDIDQEYWSNSMYNKKIFSFLDEYKTIRKFSADSINFDINYDLSNRIVEYCKSKKISILEFWLLALSLFLGEDKYVRDNPKTYISIGTPFMNRYTKKQRNTSGMFVNVLPFIIRPEFDLNIDKYLNTIKNKSFELIKHGRVSNLEIQKKYMRLNNENTNLLGIMLNYIQTKKSQDSNFGQYQMYWPKNRININPLTINIVNFDKTNHFNLKIDFQRSYFNKKAIDSLFNGLIEIIKLIVTNKIKNGNNIPCEKYQIFKKEISNHIKQLSGQVQNLTREELSLFQNRNANEWNCSIYKLSNKINENILLYRINKTLDKYPRINNTFNFLGNKIYKVHSNYHNFFYDKLTYSDTVRQINSLNLNSNIDLGSEPLFRVISFKRNNERYLCIELHRLAGNLRCLSKISQFLVGNNIEIKYWFFDKNINNKSNTISDIAFIPHTSINGKNGQVSYISENIVAKSNSFKEEVKKVYYSFILTLSCFSDTKLVKVALNNKISIATEIMNHGNNLRFKDTIVKNNKTPYRFLAYKISKPKSLPLIFEMTDTDIGISFGFNGIQDSISFIYNPSFFTKNFINHFKNYFMKIFSLICKNKYFEIRKLNPDRLLLKKNSQNNLDYRFEFVDRFLINNAKKFPNKIAAIDENKAITYEELNKMSDKVATYLINNTKTNFIGVCMNRSINTIISFYGILKAGKTYIPIDPLYPVNRINYIINDAKINEVITDNETNVLFDSQNINKLDLREIIQNTEKIENKKLFKIERISKNPAYVIYTSGTTGKPKGVVNLHKSLTNTIYSFIKLLGINSKDKFLFKTSFGFDMSLLEIVAPIVIGGTIIIAKSGGEQDPEYIEYMLNKYKPTVSFFTPSLLKTYMDNMNDNNSLNILRLIYFCGEPLTGSTLNQLQKIFKGKIYNLYGPTEACIVCTGKEYTKKYNNNSVIKIGKPFPNVGIHIINKEGQEQPMGCIGEICISGYNLAQGYLNKKELTDKAFKREKTVNGIKLVYHSGDIGRIFSNGEIECLGRIDDQVKIRGNRVELGEVNKNIMQYPGVSNAYSIIKKDSYKNSYIASVYVSSKEIEPKKIRVRLKEFLPNNYMPTILVQVKEIPSNFNGKVDKSKLAEEIESKLNKTKTNKKGKSNSIRENKFYEIIRSILNVRYVDSQQDFFEIGGNSLAVTYLVNKIQEIYKVELSLQDIYIHSKLQDLLAFIEQKVKLKKTKVMPINVVFKNSGKFKMSSNQKRMYLIQQSAPESTAYNVARYLKIPKKYSMNNLKQILEEISSKQAIFRTTFKLENNNFYQIIHKHNNFTLGFSETNKDYNEKELSNLLSEFTRPFDLGTGPLFRVNLIRGNDYNYLLFDIHHIIIDGESMRILLDELLKGISNKKIKKPQMQYVDFSQWFDKQNLQPETDYWSSRCIDGNQAEILPNKIHLDGSYAGYIKKSLDVKNVERIARSWGVSIYSLFLSIYFMVLYRYADQGEITVASPVSGRIHYETNDIVGMFVNTILINHNVDFDDTIINFVKKVNNIANDSINNQALPYEDIIRCFSEKVNYDLTKSISFFYSLSDDFRIYDKLNSMGIKFGKSSRKQIQFPISLEIIKRIDGYYEELTYANNIFNNSFANKIVNDINSLSAYAIKHPLNTIKDAIEELDS